MPASGSGDGVPDGVPDVPVAQHTQRRASSINPKARPHFGSPQGALKDPAQETCSEFLSVLINVITATPNMVKDRPLAGDSHSSGREPGDMRGGNRGSGMGAWSPQVGRGPRPCVAQLCTHTGVGINSKGSSLHCLILPEQKPNEICVS